MNLDPEYFSGVAPFGSPDYYALLFCPAGRREALRVLLALEYVLAQLSGQTAETEVRQAKLGWWAAELDRLSCGEPRHPVASAANSVVVGNELSAAPVLALFAAVVRETSDDLPRTPDALLEHAGERGAMVLLFAGMLVDGRQLTEAEANACLQLGRARFLAMELGAGHQHADAHHSPPESAEMLRQLSARQCNELRAALENIPARHLTQLAPLMVMAGLVSRLLKAMADGRRTDSISSLSSLIGAWRNARRASRGKLPI